MPYPVTFKADYVEKRSRLTTFFRLLLAIPHIIFLYVYSLAAGVLVIIAWFALLFTGRYPQGMYDFVAGSLRYSTRVYGYVWLLTDEYPPFSGSPATPFPVDLNISPPLSEYSRLKVLFRLILAIPVLIIHYAMQIVAQVGAFIAWFAIVALGRQPKGLQDMIALGTSYQQRAYSYLALITEDWPPFTDDTESHTVEPAPAFGALAATPPAAGGLESPTSVPPGGYASPEREAAFPSATAPLPGPEPEGGAAPPPGPEPEGGSRDVFQHEPPTGSEPEAPEPAAPPPPPATTSGDPLGGPTPPPEPEPYAPPEPSPSPGDWPDPAPEEPRADDDEDEPPPGPFGPSSSNP